MGDNSYYMSLIPKLNKSEGRWELTIWTLARHSRFQNVSKITGCLYMQCSYKYNAITRKIRYIIQLNNYNILQSKFINQKRDHMFQWLQTKTHCSESDVAPRGTGDRAGCVGSAGGHDGLLHSARSPSLCAGPNKSWQRAARLRHRPKYRK